MSGLLGLLLVSVSVGLSNFAGAIGIGLTGIDGPTRLRVGVVFGPFEALMPIIGLLIGQAIAGYFGHLAKYVGSAILILTGAYTVWQGRRVPGKGPEGPPDTRRLIVTAIALSIDNLAVGFALAVYRIKCSNWSRRCAGIWVLACSEKPLTLAQRGPVSSGRSPS